MSKLVRAGESYLFNYKTPELELCLHEMVEVKNSDALAYLKTMYEIKQEKIGTKKLAIVSKINVETP